MKPGRDHCRLPIANYPCKDDCAADAATDHRPSTIDNSPSLAPDIIEPFGQLYSGVYDALYADKDYDAECNLIEKIIANFGRPGAASCDILDLEQEMKPSSASVNTASTTKASCSLR